jgi:hypothetical protein
MKERGCFNCGAVLAGYGINWKFCTTACQEEYNEGEEEHDENPSQYDTLEERDMDRFDCPESQYD